MPRTVPFLDLASQYRSLQPAIDAALAAVIADTAFVHSPYVRAFEQEFAAFSGLPHCVGVGNGTDALEIVFEALELPAEAEVIVPANTFIASAEAVVRAGLRPVFCDCRPGTYTLDPDDAARRITPRTRAILPVHLYGQPADMAAIGALAERHGLAVVEDAAQAHGARRGGQPVGSFGVAGTFSFYPGKNLGAYGDAGAIVTADAALAERCRLIRNHGSVVKYEHRRLGRNSRLDGLQAAVLSAKLPHLAAWNARRRALAARYRAELEGLAGLELPVEDADVEPVYHLFVVRVADRDRVRAGLKERGIATGIHYPTPLTRMPCFAFAGQADEPLFAHESADGLLSLPIGEHLDDDDIAYVAAALAALCGSAEHA